MYTPIHQWAEDDRPREKFLLKGKSTLSDSELLAILIGSGSRNESAVQLCQHILASVDNDLNNLGKLSVKRLTDFKGIGEAKAITIAAALELGRRRKFDLDFDPIYINSSKAVFTMMHPLIGDLLHEEFWVISVNNSLKFLQKTLISKGGITGTVVDVRLVFKAALECNATGVFLVHNHPSGKLEPSEPDKKITAELMKAGEILHLPIYDHVIITDVGYYSFRDDGIF